MSAIILDDIDMEHAHGSYRQAAKLKLILKHFTRPSPIELADVIAASPTRDITEDNVDAFPQDEMEWIWTSGRDALIELILARLEQGDDPESWNDIGVKAAVVTRDHRSRLLH
jgi:hypothetical protein